MARPTRNYRLTPEGEAAVERSKTQLERLWAGVDLPATEGTDA